MKVSIVGSGRCVNGDLVVSPTLGEGANARVCQLHLPPDEAPDGGWKSVVNSTNPRRPGSLSTGDSALWLCLGKVVQTGDMTHLTYLSDDEQKLEVAHAVLKQERRYQQTRRQIAAYANLEHADAARRERIPDEVRLFVWQRDEGKCVRCGGAERLEFDHIIPVAKGGSNTERNIQLLCEACNRSKGANLKLYGRDVADSNPGNPGVAPTLLRLCRPDTLPAGSERNKRGSCRRSVRSVPQTRTPSACG